MAVRGNPKWWSRSRQSSSAAGVGGTGVVRLTQADLPASHPRLARRLQYPRAMIRPLGPTGLVRLARRALPGLVALGLAAAPGAPGLGAGPVAAGPVPGGDVGPPAPGPSGPVGQVSLAVPVRVVVNQSFLSPLVELFGDVWVGRHVFVASNTVVRADPGGRVCLGERTNLQDNIVVLARRNAPAPPSACGPLAASTDDEVSVAHQASITNSAIGRFTFIGFRARLENVVLEEGAFVLHGATVANVRIGRDRLVPIGAVITSQAEADALPLKEEALAEFQREVLEVNAEFAEHYAELYEHEGFDAVTGVSPAPRTSWNPAPVRPTLGTNVRLREFARVVGDVRLGDNSAVGRRTAIRADEGAPIVIGAGARIEDRVTFHALKGTSIRIGRNLQSNDNVVFHGPLEAGDGLTVDDDAVLFRAVIGDNVAIGSGAVVVGVTLRDGVRVPPGAVITTQEQADALGDR
jgi:carbon dioxide concentrating mechanism protein CcmM